MQSVVWNRILSKFCWYFCILCRILIYVRICDIPGKGNRVLLSIEQNSVKILLIFLNSLQNSGWWESIFFLCFILWWSLNSVEGEIGFCQNSAAVSKFSAEFWLIERYICLLHCLIKFEFYLVWSRILLKFCWYFCIISRTLMHV